MPDTTSGPRDHRALAGPLASPDEPYRVVFRRPPGSVPLVEAFLGVFAPLLAAGVIVFDDEVRQYVKPSSRQGQMHRLMHAVNEAQVGKRTDYEKPYLHVAQFLQRRGIVVLVSDFFHDPETVVKTVSPLRWRGNEIVLFHVLDPNEIRPKLGQPALLVDMETDETLEVTPEYAKSEYPAKIDAHIAAMKKAAQGAGMDYMLLPTDRPLDDALREYLTVRTGRN